MMATEQIRGALRKRILMITPKFIQDSLRKTIWNGATIALFILCTALLLFYRIGDASASTLPCDCSKTETTFAADMSDSHLSSPQLQRVGEQRQVTTSTELHKSELQNSIAAMSFGQGADITVEEVLGRVVLAPADGFGEWHILADDGNILRLNATREQSYFLSAVPSISDAVVVTFERLTADSGNLNTLMAIEAETTIPSDDGTALTHVSLYGSIVTVPSVGDGIGQWKVYSEGSVYDVDIYDKGAFTRGLPKQGTDVYVRGWALAPQHLSADTVEVSDGITQYQIGQQPVIKISGQIVGTPTPVEEQWLWRIRDQSRIYLVQTNTETQFHPTVPAPGTFVDLFVIHQEINEPPVVITMSINTFEVGEIIVRLQPNVDINAIVDTYSLRYVQTVFQARNIHRLSAANPTAGYLSHSIDKLEQDPNVLWAELNYISVLPVTGHPHRAWGWGGTDESIFVNQYAFQQVNLGDVHGAYQGDQQLIAVIDTGIDLRHPALINKLENGIDLVDNDNLPNDRGPGLVQGHGTHIGGVILHVAPESRILPIRVLDPDGRGDIFAVATAIEWAVNHDADVINLSLGTIEDSQILHDAVRWATERGVTIVAAAGNDNSLELHYPAAYTETLAITAVGEKMSKADFANYGDWVDLAAPGVGITSTVVSAQGSGYASWSGTSMAAPFVSGTVAILRDKYPNMAVAEIKQRLVNRGNRIVAQDSRYIDLLGTYLNIEASMRDDPLNILYLPSIIGTLAQQ